LSHSRVRSAISHTGISTSTALKCAITRTAALRTGRFRCTAHSDCSLKEQGLGRPSFLDVQRRVRSSAPIFLVSGQRNATPSTTRIVPIPPATTETTGPNSAAVNPDSNAPNSFDVPMKILFTDETRPRISSGVTSWTIDPRMITLTLSNAPTRNNKASDNQNILDNPKRIVAIPNPVTHHIKVLPARLIGGKCATTSATAKAPIAGAARSH